ncbi:hypothetical protein RvY_19091 [Ramazzottius varieornatus]|uniref:Uncharacterized protein n=1 Tax=Ramazzottius varieornatus TaxID=947166 RepID=A0A1D1W9J4_RAMVA|nr:hypothetical protein RvY_19091 [Ramazzottius varieornatus]
MVPVGKLTMDEVLEDPLALSFLMSYMEPKNGTPFIHLYLTCAGFRASAEQLLEVLSSLNCDDSLSEVVCNDSFFFQSGQIFFGWFRLLIKSSASKLGNIAFRSGSCCHCYWLAGCATSEKRSCRV